VLSRNTKYGLKALSYLVRIVEDAPVPISVISASENISVKLLESILLTLKMYVFLTLKKGKGGGTFTQRGEDISITSV
jgi:DNA-binding IscR family transcriptional regulator